MGETKNVLLSKTYGFNIAVALIVENFPQAQTYISAHPQTIILAYGLANIVLRHLTTKELTFARKKSDPVPTSNP